MEVSIRLQKIGKISKSSDNFRIVAMPKTSSRDSKHLEIIGHYNPHDKARNVHINQEKLQKWLNNGAVVSPAVKPLLNKAKKQAAKV